MSEVKLNNGSRAENRWMMNSIWIGWVRPNQTGVIPVRCLTMTAQRI